jgi:hypothetical protein
MSYVFVGRSEKSDIFVKAGYVVSPVAIGPALAACLAAMVLTYGRRSLR